MDRLGAAEHIFDDIGTVQPSRHVPPVADLAVDKGVMVHLVEWRHIGIAHEFADLGFDLELGDPGDKLFTRLAISDQIVDRDPLQRVLLGEASDLRTTHDRAVVIDQFADCRDGLNLRKTAEIDRRLGVPRAHQDAAIFGDQRKDMAGPNKICAAGIVVGERPDRCRAVVRRDARRRAVTVIDRDRKGGAVDRVAIGDHRREVQTPRDLAGDRRTDDAAGVADDKRHLLGRRMRRRKDQVAFVLAVVIISDDDDLATGEGVDGVAHPILRHVLCSRPDRAAIPSLEAVGSEEVRVCLAQPGDRHPP